jgi:hypothetical protein
LDVTGGIELLLAFLILAGRADAPEPFQMGGMNGGVSRESGKRDHERQAEQGFHDGPRKITHA